MFKTLALYSNFISKLWIIFFFISCQIGSSNPQETLFVIEAKGNFNNNPGAYGYINKAGKVVVEPKFEYAQLFSEGLAFVRVGGRYGCIDESGNIVIAPFLSERTPWPFSNGLAWVYIDGKYGLMNKEGKIVIQPQYSYVSTFQDGFAVAKIEDRSLILDREGNQNISKYTILCPFSEGLAVIKHESEWTYGYMNTDGEAVIPPQYSSAMPFSEGLAAVWNGEFWNFIDKTGKTVIDLKILDKQAGPFSEGLARVNIGYKVCFIDKTGKIVIEVGQDRRVQSFSEGLAAIGV